MLTVQRVVVAGVLVRQGKVFLLRRSKQETVYPGLWELPSGKKEKGENCVQALKREFYEEAGLRIRPAGVISVFDYTIRKKDEIRETTQISYLVRIQKGRKNVKFSDEHEAYGWFSVNNLKGIYISKETKKVIVQALKTSKR